jgi:drug/metabolite transporter (DMT)-like permease
MSPMRTTIYAGAALVAFATNSLLCRRALGADAIDAASFSAIRLASAAAALLLIAAVRDGDLVRLRGSWASTASLFVYAVAFSFAYLELDVGTGALILFGTVQATMLFAALRSGDRPDGREWVRNRSGAGRPGVPGFARTGRARAGGLSPHGGRGDAWGVYTLRGGGGRDPIGDTTGNFVRTLPLVVGLSLFAFQSFRASGEGVLLAVLSGALMSGVGYVVWYTALQGLKTTQAAAIQLAVPVLAAAAGALVLSEEISARLVLSGGLILGGVGLAMRGKSGRHGGHPPVQARVRLRASEWQREERGSPWQRCRTEQSRN